MDLADRDRRLLLEIFDLTGDIAVLLDATGRLTYMNSSARELFGVEDLDAAGALGRDGRPGGPTFDQVIAMIGSEGQSFAGWSGEILAERSDGRVTPMALHVLAHREPEDGPIRFYSAVGREIAPRPASDPAPEQRGGRDPLTGLADGELLVEQVTRALVGIRSVNGQHSVALLLVRIDDIDSIADALGRDVADLAQREVAERIASVVRPGDTVARIGDGEFVVLCQRLERRSDAMVIAHRVESVLRLPSEVHGHSGRSDASIEISYIDDDADPAAMLRDARSGLRDPGSAPASSWVRFDDDLRSQAMAQQRLETSLRSTLNGEELELVFQPVVSLATRRITGVETLVRWRHDGRVIQPEDFVPIAEETGLIVPVGAWVLERACAQLASWQALAGFGDLRLAVNVSARQLQHPDFAELVARVVGSSRIAAGTLWLEITESVMLDDVAASQERLDRLRALGTRIALDDFGTGYSSLTYLRRFPVDAVKLDRSFVSGIETDPEDAAIVTAVVRLAKALGKECVAEGIETEAQFSALARLGCDSGQGYLFSSPVEAARFEAMLVGRDPDADGSPVAPQG